MARAIAGVTFLPTFLGMAMRIYKVYTQHDTLVDAAMLSAARTNVELMTMWQQHTPLPCCCCMLLLLSLAPMQWRAGPRCNPQQSFGSRPCTAS